MDGRERAALAVEARRGELGMSQRELAAAASVDVKTIHNLERGGRWPLARTRARIEGALGWKNGELARLRSENGGGPPAIDPAVQRMIDGLTPEEKAHVIEQLTGKPFRLPDPPDPPEEGQGGGRRRGAAG